MHAHSSSRTPKWTERHPLRRPCTESYLDREIKVDERRPLNRSSRNARIGAPKPRNPASRSGRHPTPGVKMDVTAPSCSARAIRRRCARGRARKLPPATASATYGWSQSRRRRSRGRLFRPEERAPSGAPRAPRPQGLESSERAPSGRAAVFAVRRTRSCARSSATAGRDPSTLNTLRRPRWTGAICAGAHRLCGDDGHGRRAARFSAAGLAVDEVVHGDDVTPVGFVLAGDGAAGGDTHPCHARLVEAGAEEREGLVARLTGTASLASRRPCAS